MHAEAGQFSERSWACWHYQLRLDLAQSSTGSVYLDAVQRLPDLFATLRSVIDKRRRAGRRAGQFLLLGSASGALLRQSSESLAGRLATFELTPFLAGEVAGDGPRALDKLWLRGGFPDAYLAASDAASQRWRSQFIKTYLERDIPQLGPRIPAETLRRFWTMLAHEQGQLLNAAKLAASLAVSGQTVARYLDLMCDLMLVRRLPPWVGNAGKRLVRSPKVYVRATAAWSTPCSACPTWRPCSGTRWRAAVGKGWRSKISLPLHPRARRLSSTVPPQARKSTSSLTCQATGAGRSRSSARWHPR